MCDKKGSEEFDMSSEEHINVSREENPIAKT